MIKVAINYYDTKLCQHFLQLKGSSLNKFVHETKCLVFNLFNLSYRFQGDNNNIARICTLSEFANQLEGRTKFAQLCLVVEI